MQEMFESLVGQVLSGASGGALMSLLVFIWVRRHEEERRTLRSKLEEMEEGLTEEADRRLNEVESIMKHHVSEMKLYDNKLGQCLRHVENDMTKETQVQLKMSNGLLAKIDAKLDRYAEDTAKQSQQIIALEKYVGNLDKSLQDHRKDGGHHYAR